MRSTLLAKSIWKCLLITEEYVDTYFMCLYYMFWCSWHTSKIEIRWNLTQNYYGYYFIKLRPYPSFMRLTSKFTHSQTWQRLFHCQHRSLMSGVDIMGWHNGSLPCRVKTPQWGTLNLSGSAQRCVTAKEINAHDHKFMKRWSLVLIKHLIQNSSSRCINVLLSFHTL